jgi:hypothetical protein
LQNDPQQLSDPGNMKRMRPQPDLNDFCQQLCYFAALFRREFTGLIVPRIKMTLYGRESTRPEGFRIENSSVQRGGRIQN